MHTHTTQIQSYSNRLQLNRNKTIKKPLFVKARLVAYVTCYIKRLFPTSSESSF